MKKLMNILAVALFVVFAGYNVYKSQKAEVMSDIAMENVEALADFEMNTDDCDYSPDQECIVVDVTPTGNFGRMYFDQRNKIIY